MLKAPLTLLFVVTTVAVDSHSYTAAGETTQSPASSRSVKLYMAMSTAILAVQHLHLTSFQIRFRRLQQNWRRLSSSRGRGSLGGN